MKVRRAALNRFGESAIRKGWPMALMEEALVPLFLHHRYQVEAAASALGGQQYVYSMRGAGEPAPQPVPSSQQNAALEALAATLRASELVVPASTLDKLPARPSGYGRHRELFPRYTGLPFDPVTPGLVAADLTIQFVLAPDRAARLVAQRARDATLPSLNGVIARLIAATFDDKPATPYEVLVNQAVERALVDRLITLAKDAPMPQVRAIATASLVGVRTRAQAMLGPDAAHARLIAADITRFLDRPFQPAAPIDTPATPPGAPIGAADPRWLVADDEEWCSAAPPRAAAGFFPPLFR
jgi:hypothetical protein